MKNIKIDKNYDIVIFVGWYLLFNFNSFFYDYIEIFYLI